MIFLNDITRLLLILAGILTVLLLGFLIKMDREHKHNHEKKKEK